MKFKNLSYLVNMFRAITDNWFIKAVGAATLVMFHFLFDAVSYQALLSVFILILMDTITGLFASFKEGIAIQSHKFFRLAIKTVVYALLISAGHIAESTIHLYFIDETIIATLGLTELFSILENASRAGFTIAARIMETLKSNIPTKSLD